MDDTYSIVRNTPTVLDVLANDSDPDDSNSALSITSISSLDNFEAGTITINPDNRTIHFIPARTWLGSVTFTYAVSDGFTASQATVTLNVVPHPDNQAPAVTPSPIPDQTMYEYATLDIPFAVSDDYTTVDDLQMSAVASDATLIPNYNLTITRAGASCVLHIRASAQAGTCNVTLTVEDDDLGVTPELSRWLLARPTYRL